MRILVLLTLTLALFGCDERPDTPDSGTEDMSIDVQRVDVTGDGGGEFDTSFTQCSNLASGSPFVIAPDFRRSQLQPHAAFDGKKVWVTFSAVEEDTAKFDVFYSHVACDNTVATPVLANTTIEPNDVEPEIAIGSDAAIISWQSDRSGIQTRYRTFDLNGAALADSDALIETDGASSHWYPRPLATDDGFAIVGSRGLASGKFEVYLQQLSRTGEVVAAFISPFASAASQTKPAALWRDGQFQYAWTAVSDSDRKDSVFVPADATSSQALYPTGPSELGGLIAAGSGSYAAIAETSASQDIQVVDVSSKESAVFGDPMKLDTAPSIAARDSSGGAVVWLRNNGGLLNDLLIARFGVAGGAVSAGPDRVIRTPKTVPPFAPGIVHIRDNIYFITWAEGENPAYNAMGQFVDFGN